MRNYYKGIIIPIIAILVFVVIGAIDGGAECGAYPEEHSAQIEVRVTLDNGETYIVESYEKDVTVNTFKKDPTMWEISNWGR